MFQEASGVNFSMFFLVDGHLDHDCGVEGKKGFVSLKLNIDNVEGVPASSKPFVFLKFWMMRVVHFLAKKPQLKRLGFSVYVT
ncbi:MAG: hypothetical protein KDD45_03355 [Bdellovibrionales bacterium]|nr:hypothetical protein [Bdellovibrionales bacterium]